MTYWHVWALVFWLFTLFTGLLALASGEGSWFIAPMGCAIMATWCSDKAILLHRHGSDGGEEFE